MFDSATLAAYVAACIALLVVPGPSVIYIVTRGIEGGRSAGLVSAVGIATGTVGHVLAAALGLSAVLAGSPLAYAVIRLAGSAYLVYLGVRRLFSAEPARAAAKGDSFRRPTERADGLGRVYRQAVLVNLLNPKTALFFLAFLPQFVDPHTGAPAVQFLILGLILIGLGAVSDGTYAMIAGTVGRSLMKTRFFSAVKRYGAGAVYVGLGVFAAVSWVLE
jgi:threonine/homoserine/homoserine lactone efflux protein